MQIKPTFQSVKKSHGNIRCNKSSSEVFNIHEFNYLKDKFISCTADSVPVRTSIEQRASNNNKHQHQLNNSVIRIHVHLIFGTITLMNARERCDLWNSTIR